VPKIKAKIKAIYEPIADLVTYRAMPNPTVAMNQMDPFIFLNHHGLQEYLPKNHGLPFGPHPHRGFETVTFILKGDLIHKDSSGASNKINEGGVQWMTAGSGIIHSEISSEEFKLKGGPLEILQLWINLPAKYKMTSPKYTGLQASQIPIINWDEGKVTGHIIAGRWDNTEEPIHTFTDIHLSGIEFKEEGKHCFDVPAGNNIFLYVVHGAIELNGDEVHQHYLVEFDQDGGILEMKALSDATILFGYATPFNEPIAAYGPFVMNTSQEIEEAYRDYNAGKFGDEDSF